MKTKLLFIISLFGCSVVFGQDTAMLDTNNISAKIRSDGRLFEIFEVPKGSGLKTIFAGNIWIGGIDAGGQLHIAAQTYAQNGADFFYGPMASNYSAASYTSTYNNVWKVSKSTINYHIANYTTGGYVVPASIANWPGNGNIANGEAAVLAPYFDVNSNGTYDPANGDYPYIRGDQAVFYMVNDDKQAHGETGGTKLGIEVHGMAYSFASAADSALWHTVFVNFQIINRSVNNYDSVYFGAWTDMDLGNYIDDYVGSDSLLNMYYTFNSDNFDDPVYGNNPPAQGSVFLNYTISKYVYYNNDFTVTGNPSTASHFYQYLKGRWKDNTPLTYGGTGYGGTTPANLMFSGDPVSGTGWTEAGEGNVPADRRGMMSVGPFSLSSGQKICVDVAYPFARDYAGNNITSITVLRQRVKDIQAFYNSQGYVCPFVTSVNEINFMTNFISVYPNPAKGKFNIRYDKLQKTYNYELGIFNVLGEKVYQSVITNPKSEIDLSQQPSGIYFIKIYDREKNYTGKIIIQ